MKMVYYLRSNGFIYHSNGYIWEDSIEIEKKIALKLLNEDNETRILYYLSID